MKTKAKIEKRRASLEAQVKKLGAEPQGTNEWLNWKSSREHLMGQLKSID